MSCAIFVIVVVVRIVCSRLEADRRTILLSSWLHRSTFAQNMVPNRSTRRIYLRSNFSWTQQLTMPDFENNFCKFLKNPLEVELWQMIFITAPPSQSFFSAMRGSSEYISNRIMEYNVNHHKIATYETVSQYVCHHDCTLRNFSQAFINSDSFL